MFPLRKLLLNTTVQHQVKKFRHVKLDPGIRKRQNALLEPGEPVEEIDFDEYETDFMDVHKSHKEHVEEMKAQHEQLKYHITKQKYFKEKYPNFLTWHDKEQIKYLHSSDPEEWTIEKLSEGFPALPEVISVSKSLITNIFVIVFFIVESCKRKVDKEESKQSNKSW